MGLGDKLTEAFLQTLCEHVGAALFRKHHLAFLLRLSLDLLRARGEALQEEIEYLHLESSKSLAGLAALSRFKGRMTSGEEEMNAFQRFLLGVTVHPEQTRQHAEALVRATLGCAPRLAAGRLETAFEFSSSDAPVVCVLGEGVDVSRALAALATAEHAFLRSVSAAASEQTAALAEAAVARAAARGAWLCLHNCHLAGEWLRRLERSTAFEDAAPAFRLWLTCSPTAQLPVGLVQSSVKVALEEPTELREAMTEALRKQTHLLEGCNGREAPYCRLAFGLSFLYALLQGRRWTEPVILGAADLLLASRHLWELCRTTRRVPLEAAVCLVGDFGLLGQVSDPWNRRAAQLLLLDCINTTLLSATAQHRLAQVGASTLFPPQVATLEACLQRVRLLPREAPPELLGVAAPDDSELLGARAAEGATLEEAFRSEHFGERLRQLLGRLPEGGAHPESEATDPVTETLAWESARAAERAEAARACLRTMLEATRDGFVPSGLEADARRVARGAAPAAWMPSGGAQARIEDFLNVFAKSSEQVRPPPVTVWLPGMERPEALFAAVMQLESRSRGVALADIFLRLEICTEDAGGGTDELRVTGLWLEGADFDRERCCLVEQGGGPRELPPIRVTASVDRRGDETDFECPVYADEEKSRSIASLSVPGAGDAERWAKRGVLAFLKRRLQQ